MSMTPACRCSKERTLIKHVKFEANWTMYIKFTTTACFRAKPDMDTMSLTHC